MPTLKPNPGSSTVTVEDRPLLVVDEAHHPRDHSGQLAAPLQSSGVRFAWLLREESGLYVYAATADDLMQYLIGADDYPLPADPAAPTETELIAQLRGRTRHCLGLAVNEAARAIITGQVDQKAAAHLERSTDWTNPVTGAELGGRWDHATPLILPAEAYLSVEGLSVVAPPAGNIIWMHLATTAGYLADLKRHFFYDLTDQRPAT